jgi:hypothetical protein
MGAMATIGTAAVRAFNYTLSPVSVRAQSKYTSVKGLRKIYDRNSGSIRRMAIQNIATRMKERTLLFSDATEYLSDRMLVAAYDECGKDGLRWMLRFVVSGGRAKDEVTALHIIYTEELHPHVESALRSDIFLLPERLRLCVSGKISHLQNRIAEQND